jgi:iron complex outermembrane receptor protein
MDFGSPLTNRVVSYFTRSSNHGSVPIMVGCNPDAFPFGVLACGGPDSQFTVQQRLNNPYIAQSAKTDPISALRVWGVINTTTWRSGSSITVKNIMSYAQLRQSYRSDLFGTAFRLPPILNYPLGGGVSIPIPTGALAGTPLAFTDVNDLPGGSVSNQSTFTEELQVQGLSPDKSLAWQAGIYFEASRPLSANTGTQTATAINCRDLARLQCIDVLGEILGRPIGGASAYRVSIRHHDMGLYAQSTYAITPKLSVTAGLRYTWDRVTATSNLVTYLFPAPDTPVKACLFSTTTLADNCFQQLRTTSSAPTGLIGVEYKPTSSLLLYAKYSLGYRQGGVSATSAEGYQTFGPEHIDAYEMGAKWGFGGPIPGHLNIAAFYNELSNQQLSVVFIPKTASVSIAEGKVNAGRSLTEGIEIDLGLGPAPGLHLTLGYTYLFTELKSLAPILIPAESMYAYAVPYQQPGGRLVYSPRNKLTADIRYAFPIPEVMGKVTFGASYTWTDSQVANISSPFGVLPAFGLLNLSLDWRGIARSPIDLEFYATNVANTAYAVYDNALYESAGFGGHRYGAPRMYGVRLRYSFGR